MIINLQSEKVHHGNTFLDKEYIEQNIYLYLHTFKLIYIAALLENLKTE